jgi:chromosome segregation protein
MRLKKLELVGFKSFPNKTILNFNPGITAIVGPNGSGKSNIFDAIRWALGEQSAKSMRGTKMEDVIFSGTDKKEPLGMAEVSLTFDNDGILSVPDKEVTITRRLFRSGESEYLINKLPVRLKDINELFMGTGIGAQSYSLVEQGKIDLILSSRPEDRRLVFEEASGISKYKSQKKEAINKLQNTEQNLLRINDIIREVARQINSLQRQANKARKYKQIYEDLKAKEIILVRTQIDTFKQEKDRGLRRLNELQNKEIQMQQTLQQIHREIEDRHGQLRLELEKQEAIKTDILNFGNLLERNLEYIRLNRERIEELKKQKAAQRSQSERIKQRLRADKKKIDNFRQESLQLKKTIEQKTELCHQKQKEQQEITLSIREANSGIRAAKDAILDIAKCQTKVNNEIVDINTNLQSQLNRKKRLDIEEAKTAQEQCVVSDKLNSVTQELSGLQSNCARVNTQISSLKEERSRRIKLIEVLKSEIGHLKEDRLRLLSQKEFIEKLKTAYEDINESMQATVYLDKQPQGPLSGILVKIREQQDCRLAGEAKPIALQTQEISRKINEINEEVLSKGFQLSAEESTLKESDSQIQRLEDSFSQLQISLANKKTQANAIKEQLEKIGQERNIVELELKETQDTIEEFRRTQERLLAEQAQLQKKLKQAEDTIGNLESSIEAFKAKREKNLILITQISTELQALNNRARTEQETLRMLENSFQENRMQYEHLEASVVQASERTDILMRRIEELNSEIINLRDKTENTQQRQRELKIRIEDLRRNQQEREAVREKVRQELFSLKEEISRLQMQIQEQEFRMRSLKERILQAYRIDLQTDAIFSAENIDIQTIDKDIQDLRKKLDAMGTVNLVAIEEYDEFRKRYEFLSQQQNDLLSAKTCLHEAITKINRTTRKMFLQTFEKVATEFRNYFRILFGGGEARLYLCDEKDPLESGIEMICRPPGKKLQNILLLSGGEKSLAAIALIFAIFKVKPACFCVLDEIDAALDEANVDRHGQILQEFAKVAQFIIITHNKRTIANADTMYGITMEDSGISKIISVRFSENTQGQKLPPSERITQKQPAGVA